MALDEADVRTIVDELLDAGSPVEDLYLEVFQPALRALGDLWARGEATVTQEHFATEATVRTMARLSGRAVHAAGTGHTVVTCGVEREAHGVGVRMVSDFFTLAGWRAYHLGSDVPGYAVAASIATIRPDVVALSITMADGVEAARRMIAAARGVITPDPVFLIGGGGLTDPASAVSITGADAIAGDAREAVAIATALLAKRTG